RAAVCIPPSTRRPFPTLSQYALLLATTGCYTTSTVVTMPPLRTDFPVSASGQYVDGDGDIVEEDGYEDVSTFTIERTYEVSRHGEGRIEAELEPELQRIVEKEIGRASCRERG